jgi:hypothetical protein
MSSLLVVSLGYCWWLALGDNGFPCSPNAIFMNVLSHTWELPFPEPTLVSPDQCLKQVLLRPRETEIDNCFPPAYSPGNQSPGVPQQASSFWGSRRLGLTPDSQTWATILAFRALGGCRGQRTAVGQGGAAFCTWYGLWRCLLNLAQSLVPRGQGLERDFCQGEGIPHALMSASIVHMLKVLDHTLCWHPLISCMQEQKFVLGATGVRYHRSVTPIGPVHRW